MCKLVCIFFGTASKRKLGVRKKGFITRNILIVNIYFTNSRQMCSCVFIAEQSFRAKPRDQIHHFEVDHCEPSKNNVINIKWPLEEKGFPIPVVEEMLSLRK